MSKKCLYCYKPLPDNAASEFHPRCSKSFFGTSTPPVLDSSIEQMEELAKKNENF
jgi:serine/threonine-protein kinase HipA